MTTQQKYESPGMPLTLRTATPDDASLILRLVRALAEYERLLHEVVGTEDDLRQALVGERPYLEGVIAEREGQPVGFAVFFAGFSTFATKPHLHLEDLFVLPEERGNSVGQALLAQLARTALARGWSRVQWEVLDWNEPALRFYASLAAKPRPGWTTYRLEGDALRRLALVEPGAPKS
jgi:GNAT superfamily N-acetyltransferase